MTIGRTEDPVNPLGATAYEAAFMFGSGSRIPSGPAVTAPRRQGRTHDRSRLARQPSHFSLASAGPSTPKRGAVWTPKSVAQAPGEVPPGHGEPESHEPVQASAWLSRFDR